MARDTKSPIDINAASEEELKRIEGIDGARAKLILDHRRKHGPFQSWEQFEEVLGIGPKLTENARQAAALQGGDSVPAEMGAGAAEVEIDEVEVLTTLARLDLEAALAYEAAASMLEIPAMAEQLRSFRDDHFRHVEDLNRVIEARQGTRIEQAKAPQGLLMSLARLMGPFGPIAAIMSMLDNERLTNASYEAALELEWGDDEVRKVLERGLADEERHFEWLAEQEEQMAGAMEQPQPMA